MQAHADAFSDLVLDTLRLQETIAAAQNAPAHERAWFLQGTRQTLFIAGQHWMIRHDEACELLEPLPLAFLPHMPPWFCGLAHWHGQALPVLDLAPFWQLPRTAPAAKPMLLVLGHGAEAAGVMIDGLPLRLNWFARQQTDSDTAPSLLLSHVKAACFIDGQLWFDMDCGSLLESLENAMKPH